MTILFSQTLRNARDNIDEYVSELMVSNLYLY